MKRIMIIGGGASGMTAALFAAMRGFSVTILEKKEQLGKKLLVTGNGHCNLTNQEINSECYHRENDIFVESLLSKFSTEDCILLMNTLNLLTVNKNGYYYPRTLQASSVLGGFTERLKALGVTIELNCNVTGIRKENEVFFIESSAGIFEAEGVILAMGSEAGVKDKHPFSGYRILKELGHTLQKPLPSLTFLKGKSGAESIWQGVRALASVRFNGRIENGEVQFTKNGISGIPVFQLSHEVIQNFEKGITPKVFIDFLPEQDAAFLEDRILFESKKENGLSVEQLLKGWIHKKLIPVVLRQAGLPAYKKTSELSKEDRRALFSALKEYPYEITGHGDFLEAQVVMGGVPVYELTENFESKKVKNLFVTGELTDVDGRCGGYNLHYAFGSGKIAGEMILREK